VREKHCSLAEKVLTYKPSKKKQEGLLYFSSRPFHFTLPSPLAAAKQKAAAAAAR
jgi:hypothetical protein